MPSDAMYKMVRRHQTALTRAQNTKDQHKVLNAAQTALSDFEAMGMYPDNWSLFERAKDDAIFALRMSA